MRVISKAVRVWLFAFHIQPRGAAFAYGDALRESNKNGLSAYVRLPGILPGSKQQIKVNLKGKTTLLHFIRWM